MPTMKAIHVSGPGGDFELVSREIPVPKAGEVLLKVEACGVCHGEIAVKDGHFPGVTYPRIPGHEVMGVVDTLGPGVDDWRIGQRAGVGWHAGHCFTCPACRRGDFWSCENAPITGLTVDGGYAEYMIARTEALTRIPEELGPYEGAPLLCAGLTVFGALKESGACGGDLVAVQGIGGLGHLAVQYARKLGFRTVAISRGRDKEGPSLDLGAHAYIDAATLDAAGELLKMGGARVILCTSPNSASIAGLIGGLGKGGRIVMVTGPKSPMEIQPLLLLNGGRSIGGSVSGSIEEAIDFSLLTHVMPTVEFFPLEEAAVAFERMMTAKVRFRAVLKMSWCRSGKPRL